MSGQVEERRLPSDGVVQPDNISEITRIESRPPSRGGEEEAQTSTHGGKSDIEPPSEAPIPKDKKYTIFTDRQKKSIVLGAVIGSFFSPLSAQIYFPALDDIAKDLHVTVDQVNISVTTYMIVQAIAPMFIGSFADTAGRRPAFILCFIIYIGANIGNALDPNYAGLLVLRALQAGGSAATVSLAQAVVADVVTSAERGSYVGYTALPGVLGPSVGPIIGGAIATYAGWRWIFWFLAIFAGVTLVLFIFFLPETCRLIVGDGSIRPHPFYIPWYQLIKESRTRKKNACGQVSAEEAALKEAEKQKLKVKRPNVAKTLLILFEREMFLLLVYSGVLFSSFFATAVTISTTFAEAYGFNGLKVGLTFLPLAGGSVLAAFTIGRLANWNFRRHCRMLNIPFDRSRQQTMVGFPIERARIEICLPFLLIYSGTLIGWGWALDRHIPLVGHIFILLISGYCLTGFANIVSTLVVDINPGNAGAATAANNLTRGLIGAAATAFINPLIKAVGAGVAYTILGAIFLAFTPFLLLVLKNGVKWRALKAEKEERKKAKKEAKAKEREGVLPQHEVESEPKVAATSLSRPQTAVAPES